MSSLTPNLKFLLDENVNRKLFDFLRDKGFDVKLVRKSSSDKEVAEVSKKESRILITNDSDFAEYTKDEVFSVVWLRLPQSNVQTLRELFEKLTGEVRDFSSKLFVLHSRGWDEFNLTIDL